MSRAFTKEDDAGEDLPELPIPPGPNYMTRRSFEQMQAQGKEISERRKKTAAEGGDIRPFDRDLRYLETRLDHAIVVPQGSGDEIRFGAHVTLTDAAGERRKFQIVGDDEARVSEDFLSWSSPLAQELFGKKAGETISWNGPDGLLVYKILEVNF